MMEAPQATHRHGDIRQFLLDAQALPGPRGTALRLQALTANAQVDFEQILDAIRADPALTGFLLHAANAAQYAAMRRATNLQQAVLRLGTNIVRIHALALSLTRQRPAGHCAGFDYDGFWLRSLLRAELMTAQAHHGAVFSPEDGFTIGLLADIGSLVFATAAPQDYAAITLLNATQGCACERAHFGFDRHELAAVVLADWQLPTLVADIIYWQHAPEEAGFAADSVPYRLSCALRLASQGAEVCLSGIAPGAADLTELQLRAALGDYSMAQFADLVSEAVATLPGWAAVTGLPLRHLHSLPHSLV